MNRVLENVSLDVSFAGDEEEETLVFAGDSSQRKSFKMKN